MLVMFPRQKETKPSFLATRTKQSPMPVYRGTCPDRINGLASCVCMSSLTRSMGAVTVLSMAPAIPPRVKSRRKDEDVVVDVLDDACDIFFIDGVGDGDGARFGTETFALMREGSEYGQMGFSCCWCLSS